MLNQEIVDFIKEHKEKGKSDDQIILDLKQIGFKDSDIKLAYKLINLAKASKDKASVKRLIIRCIKIIILVAILATLALLSFYLYKKYYYQIVDYKYQDTIDVTKNDNCITEGIKIKGDGQCSQNAHKALDLLKNKATDYYNYVECYLGEIRCVNRDIVQFIYDNGIPVMEIDKEKNYYGDENLVRYASIIVHEATHAKLHYVEGWPSAGKKAELLCLDLESEALLKMGWSKEEVDQLRAEAIESEWWKSNSPDVEDNQLVTDEEEQEAINGNNVEMTEEQITAYRECATICIMSYPSFKDKEACRKQCEIKYDIDYEALSKRRSIDSKMIGYGLCRKDCVYYNPDENEKEACFLGCDQKSDVTYEEYKVWFDQHPEQHIRLVPDEDILKHIQQ